MPIQQWFPTTLYVEELSAPPKIMEGMVDYVSRFYEKNKQHYTCSLTVDTADVHTHNLHDQSTFSWLNKQVFIQAQKYLEGLGADINNINIYATKAWPVVIKKGGQVNRHKHQNSVLSVVYYLQSDGNGGGIKFHATHSEIEFLPIRFENLNEFSYTNCSYPPVENSIIIFPSTLEHEVLTYDGDKPRYSITYDLIFTMKRTSYMEYTIPDPSEWRSLG